MGMLGLARTFHENTYTCPHLNILRVLTFPRWFLTPKKLFHEKWVETSLYNIALEITDYNFCPFFIKELDTLSKWKE